MSRAQGTHGDGSRGYSKQERLKVADVINSLAPGEAITIEGISDRTGIAGRTVRAIVGDDDGVYFLLGGAERKGLTRAATREEAARKTRKMASQIQTMTGRVRRRENLARQLFGSDLFGAA